jgi:hypothetical protein
MRHIKVTDLSLEHLQELHRQACLTYDAVSPQIKEQLGAEGRKTLEMFCIIAAANTMGSRL